MVVLAVTVVLAVVLAVAVVAALALVGAGSEPAPTSERIMACPPTDMRSTAATPIFVCRRAPRAMGSSERAHASLAILPAAGLEAKPGKGLYLQLSLRVAGGKAAIAGLPSGMAPGAASGGHPSCRQGRSSLAPKAHRQAREGGWGIFRGAEWWRFDIRVQSA